jgi:hypothetical protein
VAPKPGEAVRVMCGHPAIYKGYIEHYESRMEYIDPDYQLWYHDQVYYPGTWGSNGQYNTSYTNSSIRFTENPFPYKTLLSSNVNYHYKDIVYRIPLANGVYHLRLGFADFISSSTDTCVMDVDVQGRNWKQGICPIREAGPLTAYNLDTLVTVDTGMLVFAVKKNEARPSSIFLNCFEAVPETLFTPIQANAPAACVNGLAAYPNPFNPSVTIRVGSGAREVQGSIIGPDGKIIRNLNGKGVMVWNGLDSQGRPVASGVYCLAVQLNGKILKQKLLLLR